MKDNDRVTQITPETIQQLLSEDEVLAGHPTGHVSPLAPGDEYLNLNHLEEGVRRCSRMSARSPHLLPRKDVREATWTKIVEHLPVLSKARRRG